MRDGCLRRFLRRISELLSHNGGYGAGLSIWAFGLVVGGFCEHWVFFAVADAGTKALDYGEATWAGYAS